MKRPKTIYYVIQEYCDRCGREVTYPTWHIDGICYCARPACNNEAYQILTRDRAREEIKLQPFFC